MPSRKGGGWRKTPRLGLEPRTYRLTAGRSTIELSGIVGCHAAGLGAAPGRPRAQDSPKLVRTRPNSSELTRTSSVRAETVSLCFYRSTQAPGPLSRPVAADHSCLDRTAFGPACEMEDALASKGSDLRSEESACGQRVRLGIRQVFRLGLAIWADATLGPGVLKRFRAKAWVQPQARTGMCDGMRAGWASGSGSGVRRDPLFWPRVEPLNGLGIRVGSCLGSRPRSGAGLKKPRAWPRGPFATRGCPSGSDRGRCPTFPDKWTRLLFPPRHPTGPFGLSGGRMGAHSRCGADLGLVPLAFRGIASV